MENFSILNKRVISYNNIMNNKSYWPDISLLLLQVFWGATFFIIKYAQDYISPVTLLAYRFLLGAILMALWLYFIQHKPLFKNFKQGFILGFILCIAYIAQSTGLVYISASNSGFITGLFVVFVPLFSILFLKKIPSIKNFIALGVSFAGLWILTGGVGQMSRGDLLTFVTAITIAIHILYTNKLIKNQTDPYVLNFQQLFTVGMLCLLAVLIFKQPFTIGNATAIWAMLYLSLIAGVLGYLIQNLAQKSVPPLRVSLIFTTESAFAAIFAWTLGREHFVSIQALGGLLIFLAMILSELPLEQWIFKK